SLARTGVRAEDIELVVYTHLHADHVGWTRTADGARLAFPRARYVMHEVEWSYWQAQLAGHGGIRLEGELAERFAERLDLTWRQTAFSGIELIHAPGHPPGPSVVLLTSSGQRMFVLGDMIHSPAQVSEEWGCYADVDPAAARATRQAILQELVSPGVVAA